MKLASTAAATLFLLAGAVQAACLGPDEAGLLLRHFIHRTAAPVPAPMTEAEGSCSRAQFHALLQQHHGRVIGYKAALTNPAIQRMLKANGPIWGRLYAGMLLPDGAVVDAGFGPRPTVEADLLLRVGSAGIHLARTREEMLRSLDQVIPFIELPDMLVADPVRLNAGSFAAINAGARLGVTGAPVPVPADAAGRAALQDALATMAIVVTDGAGKELGRGRGSDLLGHPLDAALWLVGALAAEGISLQPGDLLSVGSFPPVLQARAGMAVTVTYAGLPGAAPVSVSLR